MEVNEYSAIESAIEFDIENIKSVIDTYGWGPAPTGVRVGTVTIINS